MLNTMRDTTPPLESAAQSNGMGFNGIYYTCVAFGDKSKIATTKRRITPLPGLLPVVSVVVLCCSRKKRDTERGTGGDRWSVSQKQYALRCRLALHGSCHTRPLLPPPLLSFRVCCVGPPQYFLPATFARGVARDALPHGRNSVRVGAE